MDELRSRGIKATLDIIGSGPLLGELRREITRLQLTDMIMIHGFVEGDRNVAKILAKCSVGLAPFAASENDFTWFTDPQKVKFYLAAGLCVAMTDANVVASSVEQHGAGVLLPPGASSREWAEELVRLSKNSDQLHFCQNQARNLAREYERSASYKAVLEQIECML